MRYWGRLPSSTTSVASGKVPIFLTLDLLSAILGYRGRFRSVLCVCVCLSSDFAVLGSPITVLSSNRRSKKFRQLIKLEFWLDTRVTLASDQSIGRAQKTRRLLCPVLPSLRPEYLWIANLDSLAHEDAQHRPVLFPCLFFQCLSLFFRKHRRESFCKRFVAT
jgi:hypothetical protein